MRRHVSFRNSGTSIFAVEIPLQARHRDPPPSSDMDGRAELSRATQAVEGVRAETDTPGSCWNRNEIRGGLLSTDPVESWVRKRRNRGHANPSLSVQRARHLRGRETAMIAPTQLQPSWVTEMDPSLFVRRIGRREAPSFGSDVPLRHRTFGQLASPTDAMGTQGPTGSSPVRPTTSRYSNFGTQKRVSKGSL